MSTHKQLKEKLILCATNHTVYACLRVTTCSIPMKVINQKEENTSDGDVVRFTKHDHDIDVSRTDLGHILAPPASVHGRVKHRHVRAGAWPRLKAPHHCR